jgi:hypothetical protein
MILSSKRKVANPQRVRGSEPTELKEPTGPTGPTESSEPLHGEQPQGSHVPAQPQPPRQSLHRPDPPGHSAPDAPAAAVSPADPDSDSGSERGYVTAETALVLPSLVSLGLALTVVVAATADRIRCADAAWEAARLVARGETDTQATQSAARLAPSGATIRVLPDGGAVTAQVTVRLSPLSRLLPALSIGAKARITCEEGESCGSGSEPGSEPGGNTSAPCRSSGQSCAGATP